MYDILFKVDDKVQAKAGKSLGLRTDGAIIVSFEKGGGVLLRNCDGSDLGIRLLKDLELVSREIEASNHVGMNPALKALVVSAEKNKALYNFDKPDPKALEKFPTPEGIARLTITIEIPEFTSLCPITGQPDWATIVIEYKPDNWCVESKSLKLYKEGFRNFGEFHEACCQRICTDLVELLNPLYISVVGKFAARGGIPIHPTAEYFRPVIG